MGCQGGGKFDKRNVVLELESLKAWVAKGGVSCFYSFGEPLTDGLTQCLCIDRTLLYS